LSGSRDPTLPRPEAGIARATAFKRIFRTPMVTTSTMAEKKYVDIYICSVDPGGFTGVKPFIFIIFWISANYRCVGVYCKPSL
jgi:hypothetical protein